MGGREDDDAARGHPKGNSSPPAAVATAPLLAGCVLAVVAVLAVVLTRNPTFLRGAVLAAACAFALAAFAAGRRRAAHVGAVARQAELRRDHQREIEREEARHREIELELEADLRREVQEELHGELAALRRDVAALSALRREVGGLAALQRQLSALPALREELSRLSALGADVHALAAARPGAADPAPLRDALETLAEVRADLGSIADLRAELSRLRTEISEQLSGELLVERIVMRTQGARGPVDAVPEQPVESLRWTGEPQRELPVGRPALGLDDGLGDPSTREYEPVPADRLWASAAPATAPQPAARGAAPESSLSPLEWLAEHAGIEPSAGPRPRHSRHAATAEPRPVAEPDAVTAERPRPQPFPRFERLLEPHDNGRREPAAPAPQTGRRARDRRPVPPLPAASVAPASVPPAPVAPAPEPAGPVTQAVPALQGDASARAPRPHVYVQEILAEQGAPPPGGRRRRRYRDENTEDDVLSRILGK